ncbi:calcitonin gene-related peptide type 1 receptor-like isoform X2 [Chiloscyllium plagiosum]|uniref:calcitonin gene-related peptide type 1 receptor-like isoform X2 n=1 Tax=Chiloscyllium plagiosum TaxID=36176 RepID=UPI001CB8839E|nr:calcitonin gene-related peptide type 1 receptor-like isoform X2 [Chiloscyllium plagiosum]
MNGIAIFSFFMTLMLSQSTQKMETIQETPEYMAERIEETVGQTRDRIMSAQFECYLKIISDPPYEKEGSYCNRTWDGWLCWDDASAKSMSAQHCPDYYQVFDPAEKATKICTENGKWYRHPSSNRIWTNYTQCTAQTMGQVKTVWNLYYSAITGHVISIICLLLALSIFCYFKVPTDSSHYTRSCQKQIFQRQVNLFFLLNIVRVLITKLRVTHQAQSKAYMKVVRATLILVPLLGIQYVLVPAKPKGHITGEIYEHVMHICLHYQAIPVTTIFCFYNGEVQSAFKRQWSQYKVQCSHQLTSTDISHSNATSVTEIARYMLTQPTNSNHLNSKSCPETVAVKVPGIHM